MVVLFHQLTVFCGFPNRSVAKVVRRMLHHTPVGCLSTKESVYHHRSFCHLTSPTGSNVAGMSVDYQSPLDDAISNLRAVRVVLHSCDISDRGGFSYQPVIRTSKNGVHIMSMPNRRLITIRNALLSSRVPIDCSQAPDSGF